MSAVPSATPVIRPLYGPDVTAVALAGDPLVHIPLAVRLDKVMVLPPAHTNSDPVMAAGDG